MTDALNHADAAVAAANTGNESSAQARTPAQVTITVEAVIYIALAVLALVLRLADLDVAALNNTEAHEALTALHLVRPDVPGEAPLSTSPLMFVGNSLVMMIFGGSELTARLATALAGAALVLLPALWRHELGRLTAVLTAGFLLFSPTMLTTSRTMSPIVWSTVLVVVGVWLVWQFVQQRTPIYAVGATVAAAGVLLLAEPAGFVWLLILGGGWLVTVQLSSDDAPEDQPGPRLSAALADWPWRDALMNAVIVVLLVATGFFLYPRGLAQVGELVGSGLEGLFGRPAGYPFAFPLLATLLYEPVLWVLGALGVYYALRESRFRGRFFAGWVAAGLLAAVLYAGAEPGHALWLVIPLAVLAADVVARLFEPVIDAYWEVPDWAVAVLAVGGAALLAIAAVNFLRIARSLAVSTESIPPQIDPLRALLAGMSLLLLVILFFLGGSLWGARAALNGLVLGVALFLGVSGASSAWRVAVDQVDDPRELWHVSPVNSHLGLLRKTVIDASLRETGTPNRLAFVVQAPDDGALAWQLRDYADLEYVPAVGRLTAAPVIIAPVSFQPELLGARYVGQDFIVTRSWDLGELRWADLPIWLMFREAQRPVQVEERVIVWLRDDVYGLPPAEPETGEEIVP
jgi:hypothetical protein